MAKATKKSTPPDQQMSLADIYAHVHKRNSLVPPQTTTTAILTEWREGRLPLIASEVVEKRPVCPVKPGVWVGRPAPGDKKAEAYIAELSKTRIVGHLPATAPAPLPPVEERSFNRPLPRDIPRTDIKFDWTNGGVLWWDKVIHASTQFIGVGATRAAVEQVWPVIAPQVPKRWAELEIKQMLTNEQIAQDIGLTPLANALLPRMKAALSEERVQRAATNVKALTVSLKRWGLHSGEALTVSLKR